MAFRARDLLRVHMVPASPLPRSRSVAGSGVGAPKSKRDPAQFQSGLGLSATSRIVAVPRPAKSNCWNGWSSMTRFTEPCISNGTEKVAVAFGGGRIANAVVTTVAVLPENEIGND